MTSQTLNSEQKIIESEIRKFCQSELEPVVDDIDKSGSVPEQIIQKLVELGFLGSTISEEYGGAALDSVSHCIVLEELARSCASLATILAVNNNVIVPIIDTFAPDALKKKYLGLLADGARGAYVMLNEFDEQKNIAVKKENGNFTIQGEREFVVSCDSPKFFLTPVENKEFSGFFIIEPQDSISISRHRTLGLRAFGMGSISFNHVQIPADCFTTWSGDRTWQDYIERSANIAFGAVTLGIAEAALLAATRYSKERKQFNRPICDFPMVQDMLATIKIKNTAARSLVYDAAQQDGTDACIAAAIARVVSADAAYYAGTTAVQVHGGYGYTKDYPVERFLRDAKSLQVLGTTSHYIKRYIAKELLA